MTRPLSPNARKVLRQLGKAGSSLDELAARTGIRKEKLAKTLWHLEQRGWVTAKEETRLLPIYRRLKDVPPQPDAGVRCSGAQSHVAALHAAFGIGLPRKRRRGRIVRASE